MEKRRLDPVTYLPTTENSDRNNTIVFHSIDGDRPSAISLLELEKQYQNEINKLKPTNLIINGDQPITNLEQNIKNINQYDIILDATGGRINLNSSLKCIDQFEYTLLPSRKNEKLKDENWRMSDAPIPQDSKTLEQEYLEVSNDYFDKRKKYDKELFCVNDKYQNLFTTYSETYPPNIIIYSSIDYLYKFSNEKGNSYYGFGKSHYKHPKDIF